MPLCEAHHAEAHRAARRIAETDGLPRDEALMRGTDQTVGGTLSAAELSLHEDERTFLIGVDRAQRRNRKPSSIAEIMGRTP